MFDALQPHAPATFDRAAEVVRAGRPAPDRRRPLALAAALVVTVGACATPVATDEPVGFAIAWTAYGDVGPGHHTMKALDGAVPAVARLAVETRAARRPALPPDHDWPADGAWTRVRYTAGAATRAEAESWADTLGATVGAYGRVVEPVVRRARRALAARAFGRIAGAVSPSAPGLSDADLQAVLDGVEGLSEMDRPRIERHPDGRRLLVRYGSAVVLGEGVRLWIRPDDPTGRPLQYDGVRYDGLLYRTADGWKTMDEILPGLPRP